MPNRTMAISIVSLLLTLPCAAQSADDRYQFVRDDKVGFIGYRGNEVIAAQFNNAGDMAHFSDGLAPVSGPDGAGYIDPSGKFVIGPQKEWGVGRPFHEGIAAVLLWGKNGAINRPAWIDRTGRVLFTSGSREGDYFSDGLMPQAADGKWGYVDRTLKFVIPPQFTNAWMFSEGMAQISIANKSGYIDRSGTITVQPKYDITMPFMDGMGRVKVFFQRKPLPAGTAGEEGQTTYSVYLWGYVDQRGVETIPPRFLGATDFSEEYAFAMPNDETKRFGIIDKSGQFIHHPAFNGATAFSESLAAVRVGERWGYVDHAGAWVIPPGFVHADPFRHGLARVVFAKGHWGYIDKDGAVVWQNQPQ